MEEERRDAGSNKRGAAKRLTLMRARESEAAFRAKSPTEGGLDFTHPAEQSPAQEEA